MKMSTRTVVQALGLLVGVVWFAVGVVFVATFHHPVAGLILVITAAAWLSTVTSRGFARPSP